MLTIVDLIAKNNFAHARLAKQFQQHTIEKKYVAIVEGEVQFDEGAAQQRDLHLLLQVQPLVPDGNNAYGA